MRIQLVSDIHLEFKGLDLPVEGADVLVAAGDIGVGAAGLRWLAQLGCPVVYVAGNHEYWGEDLARFPHTLGELSAGTDVHFLENEVLEFAGIRFLGCTLWTDFHGGDRALMREIGALMNDFRYIARGGSALAPEDLVEINRASTAWLEAALQTPFPGRTVVVTHHAPLMRSWYDRPDNPLRYAYCNALDELLARHGIDLWIHGHIHQVSDYTAYGVRVVCNPRGYATHREVPGFDPVKTLDL